MRPATARPGAQDGVKTNKGTWAPRLNCGRTPQNLIEWFLPLDLYSVYNHNLPSRDLATRSTIPARMGERGGGANGSGIPGIYFQEGRKKKHKTTWSPYHIPIGAVVFSSIVPGGVCPFSKNITFSAENQRVVIQEEGRI